MTHIVGVIEGPYDHAAKLLKYFDGKFYKGYDARVRPRVMLPVNFAINECGRGDFLKDLRCFTAIRGGNSLSDGGKTKQRYFFLAKMLRKLFPKMIDVLEEIRQLEGSTFREDKEKKGDSCLARFYPIGEIKDRYDEHGKEIV